MFAFDDDDKDGDCKGEVHSRELDTFFSLHFCVGRESLEVFREDFKEFFEFRNRVSREGLVSRTEGEATLVPFDVTFPMDMSAEQKCFDLGGACKSADIFVSSVQQSYVRRSISGEKTLDIHVGVYLVMGGGR